MDAPMSPHQPGRPCPRPVHPRRRRGLIAGTGAIALVVGTVVALVAGGGSARASAGATREGALSKIGHIAVLNLENKGFDRTFGPGSAAPYLSTQLTQQGQLLTQYYGTAHNSLGNYLAQVSGQGPNPQVQADCQVFTELVKAAESSPGQAVGQGCVFPADVPTVADQLEAAGRTWKGYMEDMGEPCRHPAVGSVDDTQTARIGDQYAVRHDPFVYFHSIIDDPTRCAAHVVDLQQLPADLATSSTTPNLVYVTPDLCHDGHDEPCIDGQPGGLASADAFLRQWVPLISSSPAFRKDGMIVVTFDESDGPQSDASACCGEGPTPNTPLPGITGLGGGRVGAVVLSTYVRAGTWNNTAYNHYSLLRTIEDVFGLDHLGYAADPAVRSFGLDVVGVGR